VEYRHRNLLELVAHIFCDDRHILESACSVIDDSKDSIRCIRRLV
jgi:hypothetical protein